MTRGCLCSLMLLCRGEECFGDFDKEHGSGRANLWIMINWILDFPCIPACQGLSSKHIGPQETCNHHTPEAKLVEGSDKKIVACSQLLTGTSSPQQCNSPTWSKFDCASQAASTSFVFSCSNSPYHAIIVYMLYMCCRSEHNCSMQDCRMQYTGRAPVLVIGIIHILVIPECQDLYPPRCT